MRSQVRPLDNTEWDARFDELVAYHTTHRKSPRFEDGWASESGVDGARATMESGRKARLDNRGCCNAQDALPGFFFFPWRQSQARKWERCFSEQKKALRRITPTVRSYVHRSEHLRKQELAEGPSVHCGRVRRVERLEPRSGALLAHVRVPRLAPTRAGCSPASTRGAAARLAHFPRFVRLARLAARGARRACAPRGP